MSLIGALDKASELLEGWVFDDTDPEPVQLEVLVNDIVIDVILCSDYRPDLAEAGILRPRSGFHYRLPLINPGQEVNVKLLVLKTGECFADVECLLPRDTAGVQYSIDQFDWTIKGWLTEEQDSPLGSRLILYLNGARFGEVKRDIRRPDVGDVRATSGFEFHINPEDFTHRILRSELRLEYDSGEYHVLASASLHRDFQVQTELPSEDQIFLTGAIPSDGDLVLLVRYDSTDELTSGLIQRIEEFAENGYRTVICDAIPVGQESRSRTHERWLDQVEGLAGVLQRPNLGWDFGAWFHILKIKELLQANLRSLLLTNDSILAVGSSKEMFIRLERSEAQVTSLTESFEYSYHLQSFFLHFRMESNVRKALEEFSQGFEFPLRRREVIERGELGLSKHLLNCGIQIGALFPIQELGRHFLNNFETRLAMARQKSRSIGTFSDENEIGLRRTRGMILQSMPFNTTHSLWREIIELGAGFIKRDLLSKNPTNQTLDLVDLAGLDEAELTILRQDCQHYQIPTPPFLF